MAVEQAGSVGEELRELNRQLRTNLGVPTLDAAAEVRRLRPVISDGVKLQAQASGSSAMAQFSQCEQAQQQLIDTNERLHAVAASDALTEEEEESIISERDAAAADYKQHLQRVLDCAATKALSEFDIDAIEQCMAESSVNEGAELDTAALADAANTTDEAVKSFVRSHRKMLNLQWPKNELASDGLEEAKEAQSEAYKQAKAEVKLLQQQLPRLKPLLLMLSEARRMVEQATQELVALNEAHELPLEKLQEDYELLEQERHILRMKQSEMQQLMESPARKRKKLAATTNPSEELKAVKASLLECCKKMGQLADKLAPFVSRRPEILLWAPEAAGLGSAMLGHAGMWKTYKLDHFDNLEDLAGSGGRHKVMKGLHLGKPCVLKQFAVGDARNRRQLEKEIRVLQKLRHSLIVELQAVFFDVDSYLQLPYCELATLRQWMASGMSGSEVRTVTRQVGGMWLTCSS